MLKISGVETGEIEFLFTVAVVSKIFRARRQRLANSLEGHSHRLQISQPFGRQTDANLIEARFFQIFQSIVAVRRADKSIRIASSSEREVRRPVRVLKMKL